MTRAKPRTSSEVVTPPKKPAKKPAKKSTRGPGRRRYVPSKAHIEAVRDGAKRGLIDAELAKSIGIGITTFKKYKRLFAAPMKEGRAEGDPANIVLVENALLKRACGFSYTETTREAMVAEDGTELQVSKKKTVTKQVAPDTGAIVFYLCNRAPHRWKNMRGTESPPPPKADSRTALADVPKGDLKEIRDILRKSRHDG